MATILAYTSPAIGHLYPMTPLLLELAARGHDVHVRTLATQVDHLRGLGLHAAPVDARIGDIEHPDWEADNPKEALLVAVRTFCERAALDGPDLQAAVEAIAPDVVIVDINAWGALTAAEASGLPWATFSPYTPPLSSKDAPPFGPGLRPVRGPLGRLRDALVRPLVLGVAEKAMRPRINEVRAGFGLGPVVSVDDFLRRCGLMLVATAEPFEYPRSDWGDDVLLVGASPWEPPQPAPAWLDAVDRPIVLVTTSSEQQDDAVLVRTALEALADEPVFVVATMPAGLTAGLDVPANARVERFVPHAAVLDRAAVAVTHGGMGATQKALVRGVPVVVVPFGRDQLEVARRAEVSGAGVRLPSRRLTPKRLRAAVRDAMGRTTSARAVADGFARAGGAGAAADAVEQRLLNGSAALR
jgi:MGT family glycosyltransferase